MAKLRYTPQLVFKKKPVREEDEEEQRRAAKRRQKQRDEGARYDEEYYNNLIREEQQQQEPQQQQQTQGWEDCAKNLGMEMGNYIITIAGRRYKKYKKKYPSLPKCCLNLETRLK